MNRPSAPCENCSTRCFGCHSVCARYAAYKAEQEKYNTAIRKMNDSIIYPEGQMKKIRGFKK